MEQSAAGSSPLTRGKLLESRAFDVLSGLIPAHAGKTTRPQATRSGRGAHPRSRGENTDTASWWISRTGSSPLTRGKRHVRLLVGPWGGLIPAHAGKTHTACRPDKRSRAHPRSRGENLTGGWCNDANVGSSPLTRGKHLAGDLRNRIRGLIPAHAGKTRSDHGRRNRSRAHPRSRGENASMRMDVSSELGSSPLTRGKRQLARVRDGLRGLIPAHAGKTHPL